MPAPSKKPAAGAVRIGVGGWSYEPWSAAFYPPDIPQKRQLEYASRQFNSVEINSTYYGAQKAATFAKWHDETPDHFVFSVKAPRFVMNREVLGSAGRTIEKFLGSGLLELKEKLGPINWQFLPDKKFDRADFQAFLALLPKEAGGRALRHAVEVRHESFCSGDFIALVREHGVAVVIAGDSAYPQIADATASFVYCRIMGTKAKNELGYSKAALDIWAGRARAWACGAAPDDLDYVEPQRAIGPPRDVFLYVISGYKERNPLAAKSLKQRLP
jgi:uncharacterized protein YecE (DUF72 family)